MRTRLRIPRSWRAPSPCRLCRSSPCAPVHRGADVAAWAPRRASIGSLRCCTRASSLTRSSAIGPPPRSTGCRCPGGWTTASASSPSPMQAPGTRRRSPAAAPATRSTATRAGPVTRRGRAAQETRPSVLRGSSGAHSFSARHGVAAPEPAQPPAAPKKTPSSVSERSSLLRPRRSGHWGDRAPRRRRTIGRCPREPVAEPPGARYGRIPT